MPFETDQHQSSSKGSSPEMTTSGVLVKRHWYVVKTKPREEQVCLRELERREIETLCPMTKEFRYRRRRQEVVPLFPGYVFARLALSDDYHRMRWAKGVSDIVRFGENAPPVLENAVVQFLRDRMDENGVIDTSPELYEGQKVRFISEPLSGMVGTILKCGSGQGRIRVLMDLLYQATVEVESCQVKVL